MRPNRRCGSPRANCRFKHAWDLRRVRLEIACLGRAGASKRFRTLFERASQEYSAFKSADQAKRRAKPLSEAFARRRRLWNDTCP
eukprot:scaffold886_cov249-Pinguiococcus_pyrenoidosus.AAC.9